MQIRVKLYIECNAMLYLVCALNLQVLNSQSMDLNINQPALHNPPPHPPMEQSDSKLSVCKNLNLKFRLTHYATSDDIWASLDVVVFT